MKLKGRGFEFDHLLGKAISVSDSSWEEVGLLVFSLAEELSVSVTLVAFLSGCGLTFRVVELSELLNLCMVVRDFA